MRKFLIATAFVAALAGLTGCGGDDGGSTASVPKLSSEEQKAADTLKASFEEDGDLPGTAAERDCMVAKVVKSLGAARTTELAASNGDDMAKADAEKVVDAMTSCMDLGKLIAQEIASDGQISDKSAACLAKSFDKAFLTKIMMAEFTSEGSEDLDADGMKKMLDAMSKCLSAEELKTAGLG